MKNYSTTEIANILGKSRQYVWLQIISNNLIAERVGNFYVVKEGDFQEFLDKYNDGISDYNNERSKENIEK